MGEEFQSDQDFALGVEDFPSERDYKLHCLRHSTSHIMAAAIQQIFPDVKFGIGPPIKNGFYYDMMLPRPLTPDDLEEIERRMREIVKAGLQFARENWDKPKALEFFGSKDQNFKIELINGIPGDSVSTYAIGDFTDLCAGPHVRRTSECKHFKLTSIAGAYWRGSEKNPMLQRIYGTVWPTKDELDEYLHNIEEAKRRDHRKVGRELELFMTHEWAPGAPFWLPKGTVIYHTLQETIRRLLAHNGYVEVKAPLLFSENLFKTSGHWAHYKENMFIVHEDEQDYALKPMNCPGHMLIFGSKRRSYRELPLRISEQSVLHRNERTGALAGLTRVRQFQQDDAHLFITEDQIGEEVNRLLALVARVYKAFGMGYRFVLSVRGDDMSKYMGDPAVWDGAEKLLAEALEENHLEYTVEKGEANFYGPKIDQMVQDSLKREHQLGTIQLDFQQPAKLRADLCQRAQRRIDSGGDSSRDLWFARALRRHPDRALRRSVSGVARARPGKGAVDLREDRRLCARGLRAIARRRHSGRVGRARRQDRSKDSRRAARKGSVHARHRSKGSRVARGGCSLARERRRRRDAARRVRRADKSRGEL